MKLSHSRAQNVYLEVDAGVMVGNELTLYRAYTYSNDVLENEHIF